jgi:CRISPR/Cas system-associated protein endoribonuclease Cas2
MLCYSVSAHCLMSDSFFLKNLSVYVYICMQSTVELRFVSKMSRVYTSRDSLRIGLAVHRNVRCTDIHTLQFDAPITNSGFRFSSV